jgi:hypothetical protein
VATTFDVALGLSLDLLFPALLEIDFLLVTVQRRRCITASARVAGCDKHARRADRERHEVWIRAGQDGLDYDCSRRTRQRQAIGRAVLGWWREIGGPLAAIPQRRRPRRRRRLNALLSPFSPPALPPPLQ